MKQFKTVLLAVLASWSLSTWAMTDQQIISQVVTLHEQGLDEMEIAQQLLKDGATIEQLQRVKNQLETLKSQTTSSKTTKSDKSTRVDNGENTPANAPTIEKNNELTIWGQDIFRMPDQSYSPMMNQATPKNYVLGPGDEVIIDIYGASQIEWTETINPDGRITIADYGPVQLSGLTILEATRRLKNTVGKRYLNSQLLVSVGQTRTISVNIMGEVAMPGCYQLSAFANVMNALYIAGGVNEAGTLRDIKIFRNGQQVSSVDIYSYLTSGELGGNVRLEDGDVIIVSAYENLVSISGKVKRPMRYEMKRDETLDKLLFYAGGFSGDAYTDGIRIERRNNGAQSVLTVRNDQFEHFALTDGDKIQIDSILPRLSNTVEIRGAVFRPGQYGLSEQLKTLKQLVDMADGPSEDAFLTRAVLYRMKADRTFQAIPVGLEDIINGTIADIELKNEDQLFIPSKQNELENLYVVIHGEVYEPDTFRFAENESIEDLILRAGGLTDKASTSKVDIARRIIDPKATSENIIKSETFTVALQDSLAVEEHGFILKPFDEVYVRQSPAYGKQMNVRVRGEILFDGTYSMKTQDDRLSDLIRAAGGLSSHAYAKGARLQRRMTEEERMRRDQLLKINQAASSKDSVNMDKLDLSDTYFVGIDLETAIKNPGSDEDITLREGDILIIPSINNTVKINGEVLYPNTVSFIHGKHSRYYINQAGGFSNMARKVKAYVIYPNGKVAPALGRKIQPGCEIVVPSRPERQSGNAAQWVAIASSSASMASVVATVITLIINSKNASN